jgi:two-component system response regulator FitH
MTRRHKILIIEDDGLLQKMYRMKCRVADYEVDVADNGSEGLEKARNASPDLVLLDILMPRLNGLQVLAEMKRDPGLQKIPVVMLTNLSNIDRIEQATRMGAAGYLVKSQNTPQQVLDFVRDTIAKHA